MTRGIFHAVLFGGSASGVHPDRRITIGAGGRLSKRLVGLALLMVVLAARAETGVFHDRLLLGQSASLSGPLAGAAQACAQGARAYFDVVNAHGGVHGRRIEMRSHDDGYDAEAAVANTRRLIDDDRVFALFGHVGWPGVAAVLPLVTQARVPFLFPCSGAPSLYDAFNRQVFTVRASYVREYRYLLRMFNRMGIKRLALIYQNNVFGKRLFDELNAEAEARSLSVFPGAIDATSNFPSLLRRTLAQGPDAVLLVNGDPLLNVTVVRGLQEAGYHGRYFGASITGQRTFIEQLGAFSRGVVIAQVVPSPWQVSIPLVADYRKLMVAQGVSEFSFGSMEGFIGARILVEALRRAGRHLTRERLIEALESINESNFEHRGFPVNFSATNHQGADFVDTAMISSSSLFLH
ncbi:ABC transporter substrate-binding protein [Herbaspirillum sp. YR522]|uniref:ABC transporter substrate-binding protein n=1 Tax=Herbaspirillum sp. YR522 TaxID=1144342 RepID=UPI000686DB7B|nr:ABC transporter substrate-binding protein [Herbaspirillum sp. YR522]